MRRKVVPVSARIHVPGLHETTRTIMHCRGDSCGCSAGRGHPLDSYCSPLIYEFCHPAILCSALHLLPGSARFCL